MSDADPPDHDAPPGAEPLADRAGAAQDATAPYPASDETQPVGVEFASAPVPEGLPPSPPVGEPPDVTVAPPSGVIDAPGDGTLGAPRRRNPMVVVLALALVLALVVGGIGWLRYRSARDDARDAEARTEALRDELEAARDDIAALEEQLEQAGNGGLLGDLGGALDDLLGGEGGDLGGLLDDLLGGEGGDLGGLLDDLLGGEGGDFGGLLDDLLGGGSGDATGDPSGVDLFGIGGPQAVLACSDFSSVGSASIPDDDAAAQYDAVVAWVEDARGHEFSDVPEPTYLTFDEIDERVQQEIAQSYPREQADLDGALLAALGVVEPGTDLLDLQSELVGGGQVAGFYDPDTKEMVAGTDDPSEPLASTDLITLAHELDHALVDDSLGLPDDEVRTRDADAGYAQLMLTEGDATMLMNDFSLAALDFGELLGGADLGEFAEQQADLEAAPHYLARQLLFPYTQGLEFACALREEGGWEAVDAAYADLPTTSAQVMWPERYLDGEAAVDAPAPGDPGDGWTRARTTTIGAADLLFLFEAPGDDRGAALDDPVGRAAAWAGGEVTQYTNGDGDATAIVLVQRDGEADLCDSIVEWYGAAFGGVTGGAGAWSAEGDDQSASIRCDGDTVRLGIAPALGTAERLTA